MQFTQNNQGQSKSLFKMLRNLSAKVRPMLTPIILIIYVYFFAAGIFKTRFHFIGFLLAAIFAIFAFLSELILRNYSHYEKEIGKIDWDNKNKQKQYFFAMRFASAKMAFILLLILISHILILRYKNPSAAGEFVIDFIFIFMVLLFFSIALADGVNIWNIKMKEENTLRDRLFSTRLY